MGSIPLGYEEAGELVNVLMASFGNDSIALIQWARESHIEDVTVLYNDTGWSAPWWADRVEQGENWVRQLGFDFAKTESEGFMDLVRRKKAFPRQGMQFCTEWLKREPSMRWMEANCPPGSTVMVGVRRAESARRADFPEHMEASLEHGGRALWAPLATYSDEQRNALLERAGWPVLPHRSMECYPCVNANRKDLQMLDEGRIRLIEVFEDEMGVGERSGKHKFMFRPYRHQGARGIRNVVRWANDGRYVEGQEDMFGSGCDGGFCE
jgi:3'-phosphoadenosine 5'-phosphosulfate sulfotransferase (PAPS reductase)/FAD synthetase